MKFILLFTSLFLFTCMSFAQNQNKPFTVNGVSFEMVAVAGGTFTMGCTRGQTECSADEKPAHKVRVSDFYIGKYEVTQALWFAVMGGNPSYFKGDNLPVEQVTWFDCQEFIIKLNQLTGARFRLPTEAEWEYAARGGNVSQGFQYAGNSDVYEVAWLSKNAGSSTREVGLLHSNELGIHDMSGNVWEWCSDWYASNYYTQSKSTDPQGANSGSLRVLRGGSRISTTATARVACRNSCPPSYRFDRFGLRLALVPMDNDKPIQTPLPVDDLPFRNHNKRFAANGVSFEMVAVAGGTFIMGCTDEQTGCSDSEKPAHKVRVSDFSIGKHQVTQALWQAVMGTNPSYFKGANLPVEKVSWLDCQNFISKLNQLTGVWFRLPTEAEWEYAARGGNASRGTQYAGSTNAHEVAWFGENAGKTTHEVGLRRPNELGIHDMSGNVWEWCSDWYGSGYYAQSASIDPQGPNSGSYRVLRGGSWGLTATFMRVAYRINYMPGYQFSINGFRLVLVQ